MFVRVANDKILIWSSEAMECFGQSAQYLNYCDDVVINILTNFGQ